jgi:hypothetical protein
MALPSLVPGTALLLAPAPATALLHALLLALLRALAVASTLLPTAPKLKVPTLTPVLSPLFPLLRPEVLRATAAGTSTTGAQHQLSVLTGEREVEVGALESNGRTTIEQFFVPSLSQQIDFHPALDIGALESNGRTTAE